MNSNEQSIGTFTTDAEMVVRSWDASMERQTSIPAAGVVGQPLALLVPDLEARGLTARFARVLTEGSVEVLAPAFHKYLIPCAPRTPSKYFDRMRQRVTIAPLREDERIVGAIVTLLDVTDRLEHERELAEQLASPDEAMRLRAAQSLASEEALEDAPALVGALGDDSWRVRRAAVSGLTQKAEPDTIASLLRLLREEHHNLSILNSALQVLTMSGVDIITPLAEFLRGPDVDLRIQSALALGEQRDPRAAAPLLEALGDDDTNVRYHAIEALGKLRAAEAVDPLIAVAEAGDFFLAFPAVDALIRIGDGRVAPRLVPLLGDEFLCGPAAEALGRLGDEEVVAPLAAMLNQPGAPSLIICQSLAALYRRYEDSYQEGAHIADLARGAIDASGTRNLLDALNEVSADQLWPVALTLGWLEGPAVEEALAGLIGQPVARNEVIEALVRYGPRVTDLLIGRLSSEELRARQAAVIALGRIGDRSATPALIGVLDSERELTIEAAGALAKIGDPRAFEALLGIIGDPDAGVRQAAISAINSLGRPEMGGRAVALLGDPDPHVRESAVKIAGYFGYPECVDLLLARCRDEDENVRRAAVEHLPYLDDDRVAPALDDALRNGTPKVRAAAARALGQVEGREALPGLLEATRDADSWVRYFAARSIGRHGFTEATEALARLAGEDAVGHVRIAALEALGELGGPRAAAILAPIAEAQPQDLACAALKALGSIAHPDALPPLQAALRSADPPRRMAAVGALAKRGGGGVEELLQWAAAADQETMVSRAAVEALARLATPEAVNALIELTVVPSRQADCVAALAQLGPKLVDPVAQGLGHADAAVRRAVVEALGRMKHPSATERLSAALGDPEAAVRVAAVNALGRLGTRQAERGLAALARTDPDAAVRRAAEKAVRK
jgi:HEAT repeat protein